MRSSARKRSKDEQSWRFASGASYFVLSFEVPMTLEMPAIFCCRTRCLASLCPSPFRSLTKTQTSAPSA